MQNADTQRMFRRVLFRNILLPFVTGLVTSAVFVFLITTLTGENKEVRKTERIITLSYIGLKSYVDGETGLRGYALTGQDEFLEPYSASIAKIPKDLETLKDLFSDNPAQLTRVRELEILHANWLKYADRVIELKSQGKDVSKLIGKGIGKSMMDQSRTYFNQIVSVEERIRKERSDAINAMTQSIMIVVVALSLMISIVLALYGRRQLMQLSGSYEKVLLETQRQNDQLQYQQWIKNGQSELNNKMTTQRTLNELSETVVDFLAQYLKAQVGAFYLAVSENSLERKGTYAFEKGFDKNEKIQWGEGLVGQAAKEQKLIHLKNAPPDYLKVNSATGHTKPSEVIIFPVVEEGHLLAVIELGFIGEAHFRFRDFLEAVNEAISVAVNTALFREQREKLLKEIQNQTEELQTQQEELRAMNEELEEQTRILKNTQTRLEAQHAEMEQTNAQLEAQARTLETQKDLLDRRNESLVDAKLALEQKALELQRASQYKSEFLANMSHELRTPLNSSLILAKLLADNKEKNLTKQQIEFSQQILSSGNDLLNLINDILDLSKVESGKLDIHPDEILVENLIKSLRKSFVPVAEEKGLKIDFEIDPQAPKYLFTDRIRIEQILKNLLSNAIKFTTEGRVKVNVVSGGTRQRLNEASTGEWVHFEVIDTGIGIKKEHQEVIFEAFRQADGTTNRKFGGTGLGLSISCNLARLLGGQIRVSSTEGQGSTFTLLMPAQYREVASETTVSAPITATTETMKKTAPLVEPENKSTKEVFFSDDREALLKKPEKHILVVEDDKKFAQILFDLAHEQNYKCIVTDSAEEAITLTQDFHPSAVLLDIKLSGQNGLFALDQIKHRSDTRHIPVHVISGEDFSRLALHLGAMGYMLKPVRREQLVEAFEKIEAKISQHIRKVLVVEDNKVQRDAIQKLIEDKSLETTAVENGSLALKALEDSMFDCMIMDLNLPDMSGFELLETMHQRADKNYPPVIVYTGRSLSREEEMQLNRYSRSVIIKGAKSPERLLDEVTLFLHHVESRLDRNKQDILENLRHREKIFENKTIMIVDDDMRNTFALTAALENKGAKIIIAKNGEESLSKLSQNKGVDIVLMDIMMPIMDGYEAIRRIRQDVNFKKLPIIALTAKAMKDDHQLCLQAGANDYLAKPVDLDKLLSLIRIWLTAGWS